MHCTSAERIRLPPAAPAATTGRPLGSMASIGDIIEPIRIPGATPSRTSSPSPSIEFRWTPKSGTQTPEPRPRLVVTAHTLPSASTATRLVVSDRRSGARNASTRARAASG